MVSTWWIPGLRVTLLAGLPWLVLLTVCYFVWRRNYPAHLTVESSPWTTKFDVTRGEWAGFATSTNRATREGCKFSGLPKNQEAKASWRNLGFAQDDSHPVVCVKWSDAHDYVRWLSQRTGRKYGEVLWRRVGGGAGPVG